MAARTVFFLGSAENIPLSMPSYDILHIAKSINYPKNSLGSHANFLARLVKARAKSTESTTSMMNTQTICFHESNFSANCRPINVIVHFSWFRYKSLSKKLVFVPVAITMTGIHRDHLIVASNTR